MQYLRYCKIGLTYSSLNRMPQTHDLRNICLYYKVSISLQRRHQLKYKIYMLSTTSIESTSYTLKLNANSQSLKRHHKLKQYKQRCTQSNDAHINFAF